MQDEAYPSIYMRVASPRDVQIRFRPAPECEIVAIFSVETREYVFRSEVTPAGTHPLPAQRATEFYDWLWEHIGLRAPDGGDTPWHLTILYPPEVRSWLQFFGAYQKCLEEGEDRHQYNSRYVHYYPVSRAEDGLERAGIIDYNGDPVRGEYAAHYVWRLMEALRSEREGGFVSVLQQVTEEREAPHESRHPYAAR